MDDSLSYLSSYYNFDIIPNLANSSIFKTRILCPNKLFGEPFWKIKIKKSNTFLEKIKNIFGLKKKEIIQTDLINNFLK